MPSDGTAVKSHSLAALGWNKMFANSSFGQRNDFIEAVIADILDIIRCSFWKRVIDSQASWAKLTKLAVLPLWVNISIDFVKQNILNSSFISPCLPICSICDE